MQQSTEKGLHKKLMKGRAMRAFNVAAMMLAISALAESGPVKRVYADGHPQSEDGLIPAEALQFAPAVLPPEPPAPSIQEIISTDEEKTRNIFFAQNRQSIREFRALRGDTETTGALTTDEKAIIDAIATAARTDAKTWQIPRAVAATLRFASEHVGIDHDAYMTRLTETGGLVTSGSRAGMSRTTLFKFTVPTWLYLMKQHGAEHGFGYFTDQIRSTTTAEGSTTVSVDDPAVLRQIIAMRANPRISAVIGAEFMQHEFDVPEKITYHRSGYRMDPLVGIQQEHLLTLGFELGIRGADGISGALTKAALSEFTLISRTLFEPGKNVTTLLAEASAQAIIDSERYTNQWRTVSPADAFAIRHAAKVVGVDYGYMMELVSAESGFVSDIEASTSSATGLFQFIDSTWLLMLHTHGEKYGLKDLASKIEITEDRNGYPIASITDPFVQKYALSLRTDPRLSALMGAEFVKENYNNLSAALPNRDITRTDQYLAHFMGSGNAVTFISRMDRNGKSAAARVFPAAAGSNRNVFYKRGGAARSFTEVYSLFSQKFDTATFEETPAAAEPPTPATVPMPRPRPRP